jgi:hypothetical protein
MGTRQKDVWIMKQKVMEDGTVITGSEDVPTNLVVEPNRAMYRARIFGKRKVQKATTFNRQNGRTLEQYKKAGFKGYFPPIVNEETEAK